MLVIIEGADGTGKTTLAKKLAQDFKRVSGLDATIAHRGVPTSPMLEEYGQRDIDEYHPSSSPWAHPMLVCDRWHWGELVYGPIYRGKSMLASKPDQLLLIDNKLLSLGAVFVHLTHDPEVLKHRHRENGEDYLQPEHVKRVVWQFAKVARRSPLPTLTYTDPTSQDAEDVLAAASIFERMVARAL